MLKAFIYIQNISAFHIHFSHYYISPEKFPLFHKHSSQWCKFMLQPLVCVCDFSSQLTILGGLKNVDLCNTHKHCTLLGLFAQTHTQYQNHFGKVFPASVFLVFKLALGEQVKCPIGTFSRWFLSRNVVWLRQAVLQAVLQCTDIIIIIAEPLQLLTTFFKAVEVIIERSDVLPLLDKLTFNSMVLRRLAVYSGLLWFP